MKTSFFSKVNAIIENIGYARAAKQLLLLGDERLIELGFSKERIMQGKAGLPWVEPTTPALKTLSLNSAAAMATEHAANTAHYSDRAA